MSLRVLRLHESGATPYPQRTDFAIPRLERGHTEAASRTKASSASLLKRKRQNQAEEAFVASPSLVQHSHLVPA